MFSKRELTDTLINAILTGRDYPDRSVAQSFKKRRLSRCVKAILSRNLFIPITVNPQGESLNDAVTGYSLPLQQDVLLWGFTWCNAGNVAPEVVNFRLLYFSADGNDLTDNVGLSQQDINMSGGNGGGGTTFGFGTTVAMPCPVRVPAGGRVMVQFNYAPVTTNVPRVVGIYDSVLLLCLAVKTCLDDEDRELLERCRSWIEGHEYQVGVMLNSVTPGVANLNIVWPGGVGAVGAVTTSETRPVSAPLLVRSIATNLNASRMNIRDSRGHQFSPPGLFLARHFGSNGAAAPVQGSHFRLAMPHVLATGVNLITDHLDGTGQGAFFDGGVNEQNWLTFGCVTP